MARLIASFALRPSPFTLHNLHTLTSLHPYYPSPSLTTLKVYTGKAHLMADITEVVVRRWQLRLPEVVKNCKELITTCDAAKLALQNLDWEQLGACFSE